MGLEMERFVKVSRGGCRPHQGDRASNSAQNKGIAERVKTVASQFTDDFRRSPVEAVFGKRPPNQAELALLWSHRH